MRLYPRKTLWDETAPAGPEHIRLQQDLRTEVAIVGGGFTGLSTAQRLAERGQSVVVLEAGEIGTGASGRNAGFVVPHFSRVDPTTIRKALPPHYAERLLSMVERGGDHIFEKAKLMGLGRQAEQSGWLQPAHTAQMAQVLEARAKEWQKRRRPVRWLSAPEVAEQTGMDVYFGALYDASGGMINPLALARELARLAMNAGANVFTSTIIDSLRHDGKENILRTSNGVEIRADKVIIATNSGTHGAAAGLGRTVMPLQVYQIATEPLDPRTVSRIAPNRTPVSDTRTNIFTYRLDAENRLISGGMALIPLAAERRMGRRIAKRLAFELGLSQIPSVEYVWRGTAAVTRDGLPSLVDLGTNVWGATGCNGRGVAFTNVLGVSLADWLISGSDPDKAPLPVMKAIPLPLRGPGQLAPSAVLARGMLRDWFDARKSTR
ncbi:NAD(P)/FAD-dependent oxidoreductase [Loktanella sp. DJP18]|uniref:NAD(P)/FAD-dependent oxidoreductase n=1 Tax=Loktanella sp. DJP18 TaxID=3409788 RepID=UPI003BB75F27